MPYFEVDNEKHMAASGEIAIHYRYTMLHIVKKYSLQP